MPVAKEELALGEGDLSCKPRPMGSMEARKADGPSKHGKLFDGLFKRAGTVPKNARAEWAVVLNAIGQRGAASDGVGPERVGAWQ